MTAPLVRHLSGTTQQELSHGKTSLQRRIVTQMVLYPICLTASMMARTSSGLLHCVHSSSSISISLSTNSAAFLSSVSTPNIAIITDTVHQEKTRFIGINNNKRQQYWKLRDTIYKYLTCVWKLTARDRPITLKFYEKKNWSRKRWI